MKASYFGLWAVGPLLIVGACEDGAPSMEDPEGPLPEMVAPSPDVEVVCEQQVMDSCTPDKLQGLLAEECSGGQLQPFAEGLFESGGVCAPAAPVSALECPGERDNGKVCLPEAPQFEDWVCQETWTRRSLVGFLPANAHTYCQPVSAPESCPLGSWPRLGMADCQPLGDACPDGGEPWPTDTVLRGRAQDFEGRLLFVTSGPGSPEPTDDGSRASPFASLSLALEASSEGDIIALASGDHVGGVLMPPRVAVVGACAGQTRLTGSAEGAVITLSQGGLVRELALEAFASGVVCPAQTDCGVLKGAAIRSIQVGVHILEGASLTLEEVLLEGAEAVEAYGGALLVEGGARVQVFGLTALSSGGSGVQVNGTDTRAELEDVLVVGVRSLGGALRGSGIEVSEGAYLQVRRLAALENAYAGLVVLRPDTVAVLEDVHLRNNRRYAVAASRCQEVRLERALIEDNYDGVLTAFGCRLALDGVVFVGTGSFPEPTEGAVVANLGAAASLRRVALVDNFASGIGFSAPPDEVLVLEDVLISGGGPGALTFTKEAQVRGSRIAVLDAGCAALNLGGSAPENGETMLAVALEDLTVQLQRCDTDEAFWLMHHHGELTLKRVRAGGRTARGALARGAFSQLNVQDALVEDMDGVVPAWLAEEGSSIDLVRLATRNLNVSAIGANNIGSRVALTDAWLRPTRGMGRQESPALGVQVQQGASVEGRRIRMRSQEWASAMAVDDGSTLILEDALLETTSTLDDSPFSGVGVLALAGAQVSLRRVHLLGHTTLGVGASEGASVAMSHVVVEDQNPIGGRLGRGLELGLGATAQVDHSILLGNVDIGVLLHGEGTALHMTDSAILNTKSQPEDGLSGRGLMVQTQAMSVLQRVLIMGNQQIGLGVAQSGSVLEAEHLLVRETTQASCEQDCPDTKGGTGVALWEGSEVSLSCFGIEGNAHAGLMVANRATLSAEAGYIVGNRFGFSRSKDIQTEMVTLDDVLICNNTTDYPDRDPLIPSLSDTVDQIPP